MGVDKNMGCRDTNEASCVDAAEELCIGIAREVTAALDVGWPAAATVTALIKTHLDDHLSRRKGCMLECYLEHQLEILATELRKRFKLPNTVKVNHNHAMHAKFVDIVKAVKEKQAQANVKPGEIDCVAEVDVLERMNSVIRDIERVATADDFLDSMTTGEVVLNFISSLRNAAAGEPDADCS